MAAWISVESTTEDSVTLYLSNLDTNWQSGERTVYWYIGYPENFPTEEIYYQSGTATLYDGADSGGHITFTGLEADTEYGIYCTIYYGDTFLSEAETWVYTDSSSGTTIDKWDWYFSNGNAEDTQTSDAYFAVAYYGDTTSFSYRVWNDMVDKVYEVIRSTTNWWDSGYATYEDTKMTGSYETLTADMFNSLRNNIELVGDYLSLGYRTEIGQVYPGDTVYGDYFLTLANYINACIDYI